MTTSDRLNRLHAWIASLGMFTVRELIAELEGLRKGPEPERYADLPGDGIGCQELLCRLAADGRAKRLNGLGMPDANGSFWRWAERCKAVKETQTQLFG